MSRYPEELLFHAKHPVHAGELTDACVGTAVNHNCGDDIVCYLRIEEGAVRAARHGGVGCALSTAAVDWLCADVVGKTVDDVMSLKDTAVADHWGLVVSPMRARCAALAVQAMRAAAQMYERS